MFAICVVAFAFGLVPLAVSNIYTVTNGTDVGGNETAVRAPGKGRNDGGTLADEKINTKMLLGVFSSWCS